MPLLCQTKWPQSNGTVRSNRSGSGGGREAGSYTRGANGRSSTAISVVFPRCCRHLLIAIRKRQLTACGLRTWQSPLAEQCFRPREAYHLEVAALLHDIGKIGVPDSILLKPGPLDDEEWAIMRRHDRFGVEIVSASFGFEPVTEIIRHHHSRFEKQGKDQIPLGARIVCIADAFDAMTSDRPYRKGMSMVDAFAELRRCAGTQFDGELVELFCEIVERDYREVPFTREGVFSRSCPQRRS